MFDPRNEKPPEAAPSLWRRVVLSVLAALIVGTLVTTAYTWFQYGGTPFDRFFKSDKPSSPHAGKLAFDKGTKFYIGVIRGEGRSPRRGDVYFIEQPGGVMIEVPRERVEVREPGAPRSGAQMFDIGVPDLCKTAAPFSASLRDASLIAGSTDYS